MKKNAYTCKMEILTFVLLFFFAANNVLAKFSSEKEENSFTFFEKNIVVEKKYKKVEFTEVLAKKLGLPLNKTNDIICYPVDKYYFAYLQLSGANFFNVKKANVATIIDLFFPLWQKDSTDLVFTDIRFNNRTGTPFEGNIHLGYKHLFIDHQSMFGIYGAFDRRKTYIENFFNQFTIGGEYWFKRCFFGGNVYVPFGSKEKKLGKYFNNLDYLEDYGIYRNTNITENKFSEKAIPGVDIEIGYEFLDGLISYVGGYYFHASDVNTVVGPRIRATYDFSMANGKRILGVFDKVGLEAGVQYDKPRGAIWYLSANVKIGMMPDKGLNKHDRMMKHMLDLPRRDIDIVAEVKTETETRKEKAAVVKNYDELNNALVDSDVYIIDIKFKVEDPEKITVNKVLHKKRIIFNSQADLDTIDLKTGRHKLIPEKEFIGGGKVRGELTNTTGGITKEAYKKLIAIPSSGPGVRFFPFDSIGFLVPPEK